MLVNGVEISDLEIEQAMSKIRADYEAYVKREGGDADEAQLREWATENLVEALLFRLHAVAHQPMPSAERIQQELSQNAVAYQAYAEEQRSQKAREALQERRLLRQIRKGVLPPDKQKLREYYEAHPEVFVVPEMLQLTHICLVVNPITRAERMVELLQLKSMIEQGRLTWLDAVHAYSESFEQDHGIFAQVSRGELPEETEKKLFNLQPGQISDVIDFDGGTLHLFQVLKHCESRCSDFNEVRESLAEVLFETDCRDALNAMYDELKASAVIQSSAGSQGLPA